MAARLTDAARSETACREAALSTSAGGRSFRPPSRDLCPDRHSRRYGTVGAAGAGSHLGGCPRRHSGRRAHPLSELGAE